MTGYIIIFSIVIILKNMYMKLLEKFKKIVLNTL